VETRGYYCTWARSSGANHHWREAEKLEQLSSKMAETETLPEPSAKRRKSNHDEEEEAGEALPGLEHIRDCTLNDASDWCPATYGALLGDPSTHDVTFKTSDGGSVSAHRVIVAAGSPVFRAMLYGDMKEGTEKEINVPSVDRESLSSLVMFLYTGTVNIRSSFMKRLLDTAHYFNVVSLEAKLVDFITQSLNVANVVDVVTFAQCSKFPQLYQNCLSFMSDHAKEIVDEESFENLPSEILLTFCKSSDLEIREVDLFVAVVQWYKHQEKLPETVCKQIFQEIRYPLMSEEELIDKVRPTKMADSSLYTAALEYQFFPDKYKGPLTQITHRKLISQNIKYVNANYQCMVVSEVNDGLIISKFGGHFDWNGLCAILVCPTTQQPVHFRIVVDNTFNDDDCGHLYLSTHSYDDIHPQFKVNELTGGQELQNLAKGDEIDGVISVRGDNVLTTIHNITNSTPIIGVVYFHVHMTNAEDEVLFSLTHPAVQ